VTTMMLVNKASPLNMKAFSNKKLDAVSFDSHDDFIHVKMDFNGGKGQVELVVHKDVFRMFYDANKEWFES